MKNLNNLLQNIKEKFDLKDIEEKLNNQLIINNFWFRKQKFCKKDLNKEIIKYGKIAELNNNNLIKIKAFKTARSFYYYNPELFQAESWGYIKLENFLYVNYNPIYFYERLPQIKEYELLIQYENTFSYATDIGTYEKVIESFFEVNHNSSYTLKLHIIIEPKKNKGNSEYSFMLLQFIDSIKFKYFISCIFKITDKINDQEYK